MDGQEVLCKWVVVDECEVEVESSGFWQGVSIWIERPHILNKRICAVSTTQSMSFNSPDEDLTWKKIVNEIISEDSFNCDTLSARLEATVCHSDCDADFVIETRNIFPKQVSRALQSEILIKDRRKNAVIFIPRRKMNEESNVNHNILIPQQIYAFEFVMDSSPTIKLLICDVNGENSRGIGWLKDRIFPKILQWTKESLIQAQQSPLKFPSLRLISTQRYVALYQQLKQKYGPKLIEIWPEKTDPHKFVYEDIGLAAYLLILWELQRQNSNDTRMQSFVDLGCGNGLLVHILCSEGHSGIGIDLKRRKIWDYFGPETNLKEVAFTPSSSHLFPDYDWIIGNHSDELTPWIPVIAAKSSARTSFFLLPCCAHNFDSKFQRRDSKLSQYEDYIQFVCEIVRVCGFKDEMDKLRIPSTKRVCLIGRQRAYKAEVWPDIDMKINQFIQNQCGGRDYCAEQEETLWAGNFHPRSNVQLPRNCTTIEQNIKDSIVKTVVDELLKCSDDTELAVCDQSNKIWHKGGSLELATLAKIVKPELLQKLKSEFGGLQTLLRNHHHIFQVIQGRVQLRNYLNSIPIPKKKRKEKSELITKLKTKPCWFYENHPDGCILNSSECPYVHGEKSLENLNNLRITN